MRSWMPTERQLTLLDLVKRAAIPPTLAELGRALGVSTGQVQQDVAVLVAGGYLHREPRKARTLKVIENSSL